MSTIYVCDGCGKQSERRYSTFKPADWFEKSVHDGPALWKVIHACSRPCIELASQKHDTSPVVLPV